MDTIRTPCPILAIAFRKCIDDTEKMRIKELGQLNGFCSVCQKHFNSREELQQHAVSSESHLRQACFINRQAATDHLSNRFLVSFLGLLRREHQGNKVVAEVFYRSYLHDPCRPRVTHTRWKSLPQLVSWLENKKLCSISTEGGETLLACASYPVASTGEDKTPEQQRESLGGEDAMQAALEAGSDVACVEGRISIPRRSGGRFSQEGTRLKRVYKPVRMRRRQ